MELIDRDALLAAYDAAHKGPPGGARKLIEQAPAIEAVPVRHGRWEYIPGDGKFRAILICSSCRRNVGEYNRFNYCPHCGAKMDLEETK